MSWGKPKPPSESHSSSISYGYAPGFNSNVDAIITNLFCKHAFGQASSRKQKQSNFCLLGHYFHQSNLNLHYSLTLFL